MSARIIAAIDVWFVGRSVPFVCAARRAIADPWVGDQTYIPQSFMVAKYIFQANGVRR